MSLDLQKMWAEADKKSKDYREAGDKKLLAQMLDAYNGLRSLGWREIEGCPKNGKRFLAICPGDTGVFVHYYKGEWPNGHWWAEAHGDLWPSRPILWKPLPEKEKTPKACG